MTGQRLNLGIDLDGVICNLWDPFRREVLIRTGVKLPRDIPTYNVTECSKLTVRQVRAVFKEGAAMYQNLMEIPGAKSSLRFLRNHYKICIITHRDFYKGIQKDTKDWLTKHGIFYDKIIFTGLNKTRQILGADCEYMIEDRGEVAVELAKKRQKVILFDYPYNRNFNHRLIKRVKNWGEIVGILIREAAI